ncbi:hypothetical protein [Paraburkholderia sp. BCC1886]|uniref:hypothetical protein n=1 Tax=Paraburkholderia sp. BCC1886 TaxID=2562670 RepID=UPI001182C139|nr:hypothetical protein [Paraburkholderia sp. BCC1886]
MIRSAIPFNISLLELTPARLAGLRPVRSLDFFDGNSQSFHDDGLFSVSIFGKVGDEKRSSRFSYIDIKVPIFHPVVYRALVSLKRLYGEIISGQERAVWNPELRDFERSDAINGQTGFAFFVANWKNLVFAQTKSDQREQNIKLIEKYRDKAMTSKIVVMPAGMRDLEIGPDGRIREDEINTIYRTLLAKSNAITENVLRANPEIINTVRFSLQNTFCQLYDLLESMIEGKKKLLLGKWASRRVFDGTRNVITAMDTSTAYLGAKGNPGYNNTVIGLYQMLKAARPVATYQIRNGFLQRVFLGATAPARLVNKKTLMQEPTMLKPDYYDRWMTTEGVEKIITAFGEEDMRHKPIEIDGKYLGLIYKGPDHSFRLFSGLDELPDGFDKKYVTPLTFCELLYASTYRHLTGLPLFITRYPITGIGSIVPSKAYVKTTIRAEAREELGPDWRPIGEDYTAYEFPITGGAFINSLVPHSARLGRMGADFDGDTASANVTYTDESIAELDDFLGSRRAYVGTDGRALASVAVSTVELVLHNLTGD